MSPEVPTSPDSEDEEEDEAEDEEEDVDVDVDAVEDVDVDAGEDVVADVDESPSTRSPAGHPETSTPTTTSRRAITPQPSHDTV